MQDYQRRFIEFALEKKALKFGQFTLKSGRVSPYFFNTGSFDSGAALKRLGQAYAAAIAHSEIEYDLIYGPAYKGIPLGTAIAIAIADTSDRDVPLCFNRKEAKDHGEGGNTLGAPLVGRVLIVDDVISAGTSVNESVQIIRQAGAEPAGVVISLDRQERGGGHTSAVQEVQQTHNMPVGHIIGLSEIVEYLIETSGNEDELAAINAYREQYGVAVGD